jgi:heat shock protein HslJ
MVRGLSLAIAFGLMLALNIVGVNASWAASGTPAELLGEWQLVTLQGAGGPVESVGGAGLTLGFQADGRATGNGGCNVFGATVTTDDRGRLQFDQLVSTLRGCDGVVGEREARYLANLRDARGYSLDGTTLRLNFDEAGRQLVFERASTSGAPGLPNTGGGFGASAPPTTVGLAVGFAALLGLMAVVWRRGRILSSH